jgi:hypothetical protein
MVGALALTLLATAASAGYAAHHLKNASAALHPPVAATPTRARPGALQLEPSVHTATLQPVTSTYAS